jgi:hypothetical protein
MGIETLNTAARAAGFAMASADEETGATTEMKPEMAAWRPGEGVLAASPVAVSKEDAQSVAGWVKGLFGMSDRAPA